MAQHFKSPTRAVVAALAFISLSAVLRAQSSAPASPIPDWQKAAGGKMSFDVVSVKQNTSRLQGDRNFNWAGAGDEVPQTGGLFIGTNLPLYSYIFFAYRPNMVQQTALQDALPKWTQTERFDIEGRAGGNPTRDQYRLMLQSLLADRFKLVMRLETRDVPVLALVLAKPGKFGPQLRLHVDDPPCADSSTSAETPGVLLATAYGFPQVCGRVVPIKPQMPGPIAAYGGRNVTLTQFCDRLGYLAISELGRPIVDKTGITGTVDLFIEWAPPVPPNPNITPAPQDAPGLAAALNQQLGLKLESTKTPLETMTVDHIEEPTPN